MQKILIIALSAFLLIGCKKDKLEIPEENGEPVFTVEGSFDGLPLTLEAGVNGAYMFTETDIENNVNFYNGEITDGVTSLSFGIYDGKIDIPGQPELVNSPSLEFTHVDSFTALTITSNMLQNNGNMTSVEWFIDGVSAGVNNDLVISQPGRYDICAKATYAGGATSEVCNDIIVGYERTDNFYINYATSGGGTLTCEATPMGSGVIESVNWYLNGSHISTYAQCNPQTGITAGELKAVVTFQSGAVREKKIHYDEIYPSHMIEDFSFIEELIQNQFYQDFKSKLVVVQDGTTYYSNIADNSNSVITVNSVEYFGNNADNDPVFKVDMDVTANVRATPTSPDKQIIFHAVFGIEGE